MKDAEIRSLAAEVLEELERNTPGPNAQVRTRHTHRKARESLAALTGIALGLLQHTKETA